MKVMVLGCGPAGLMAAHAAAVHGDDVLIFSKKRKSEMYGCQYLHAPIPGMTDHAGVRVSYRLEGSAVNYQAKVYGDQRVGSVSPLDLPGEHLAWDIRQTYNELWSTYGKYVIPTVIDGEAWVRHLIAEYSPDVVFSTVPAPLLCAPGQFGSPLSHDFTYQPVWAIGDAPERGVFSPVQIEENTIVCNGNDNPSWYRVANVFGYTTVEWPTSSKPPVEDVALVEKPLHTTCNCLPNVTRLGRYGKWQKGVLSHTAFFEAQEHLLKASGQPLQGMLF